MAGMTDADEYSVKGVQYGIISAETIERMSAAEILVHQLYKLHTPLDDGLHSLRLGVYRSGDLCQTCANNWIDCPGHFGHVALAHPVVNIEFAKPLLKCLGCVCYYCSALLLPPTHSSYLRGRAITSDKKRLAHYHSVSQRITRCADRPSACGGLQPSYMYGDDGLVVTHRGEDEGRASCDMYKILQILRNISHTDLMTLGFDPIHAHPMNMIWSNLIIPPPVARPPIYHSGRARREDDLTIRLKHIVKINNQLKHSLQKKLATDSKHSLDLSKVKSTTIWQEYIDLITAVTSYQSSRKGHQIDDYGADKKGIRYRFTGKTSKRGRFRNTILGKRQNHTARTVITGDPYLQMNEVGVPIAICSQLIYEESVTRFNLVKLTRHVRNGPKVYPGAFYVRRNGKLLNLKFAKAETVLPLKRGDVVSRHLVDGDDVLLNRQPSLHKLSVMGHKVKVVDGSTFRLHVATTQVYNADFDGDEMNLHVVRTIKGRAEAQELMSVNKNIFKDGRPAICFVQHAVLAVYTMTKYPLKIERSAMAHYLWEVGLDTFPSEKECFDGLDLLSTVLPKGLYLNRKGIKIVDGVIQSTVPLDKHLLNNIILESIWRQYDTATTVAFMNNLHRLTHSFTAKYGRSIHMDDCKYHDEAFLSHVRTKCTDYTQRVQPSSIQPPVDIECKISQVHAAARDSVGQHLLNHVRSGNTPPNGIFECTDSGAKGNLSNLIQIAGMIGQQLNDDTSRIFPGTIHATNCTSEQHGLITSSYCSGMTCIESFHHLRCSRGGLIGTACKVGDTGYSQRKLVKAMEDIIAHHDGSIRHVDGRLIQRQFAGDGFSSESLLSMKIHVYLLSCQDIVEEYYVHDVHKTAMTPDACARWEEQKTVFPHMMDRYIMRLIHLKEALNQSSQVDIKAVATPIDFEAILHMSQNIHPLTLSDITPYEVGLAIDTLSKRLIDEGIFPPNVTFEALFYEYCNIQTMWTTLTRDGVFLFTSSIYRGCRKGQVVPGELVGVAAGQSCIEPLTQMTLNSFHSSGALSTLVGGVQRMKELMNVVKIPKTPFMRVRFLSETDARVFMHTCVSYTLGSIVDYTFEPTLTEKTYRKIQMWETFHGVPMENIISLGLYIPFTTLLKKTRQTKESLVRTITSSSGFLDMFTYETSSTIDWVITFHLHDTHPAYLAALERLGKNGTPVSPGTVLMALYKHLFSPILMNGISNIRDCYRDERDALNVITIGSSFADVLRYPGVDIYHTTCSNVYEIYLILGIDAAAAALKREWMDVMAANEANVSARHITLIADLMMHRGEPAPITYQGICTDDTTIIRQASFEKTLNSFIGGAVHGVKNKTNGGMSAITWNSRMYAGTTAVEVVSEVDTIPVELEEDYSRQWRILQSGKSSHRGTKQHRKRARTRGAGAHQPPFKKKKTCSIPQMTQHASIIFTPYSPTVPTSTS